jgi:hypothetical protein
MFKLFEELDYVRPKKRAKQQEDAELDEALESIKQSKANKEIIND